MSFRLEGSYQGLFQGGQAEMMPDSPSIMTIWASGRERATRADSEGFAGFDLSANPLGASAGLSEATSGEDEPGVPVAVGWELGVAGVE